MAKRKADLEQAYVEYSGILAQAKIEFGKGDYISGLRCLAEGWEHLADSLLYLQKHLDTLAPGAESIELALHWAPLVFASSVLNKLAALKTRRRIERLAAIDISARINAAKAQMEIARQVWTEIESFGRTEKGIAKDLGNRKVVNCIISAWKKMDVIRVDDSGALALTSDQNAFSNARCPGCGAAARMPRVLMLEPATCNSCRQNVQMVRMTD